MGAFIHQPRIAVSEAAVGIVGLLAVPVQEFGKIAVMQISRKQIQPVISVAARRHIDIAARRSHGNIALPADAVPVERMRRIRNMNGKIPYKRESFGVVRRAAGGFQPFCLPCGIIERHEREHGIDPGFLVHDIGGIAGTSPVFKTPVLVFQGPFPGPDRRVKICVVFCDKIKLNQEPDHARRAGFGVHAAGSVILIGAVKTAVPVLLSRQPVGRPHAVCQPAFMADSPLFLKDIRVQNRLHAVADLPHPQRLRLVLMGGKVHPQPRKTGVGHGMAGPVFQDAQSLSHRLGVFVEPAPAEQLITDPCLLAHKTDLRRK